MALIDDLRAKFAANEFEFSRHALDQTLLRGITVQEVREAAATGQVIEDYPTDKYGRVASFWASRWQRALYTFFAAIRLVRWPR